MTASAVDPAQALHPYIFISHSNEQSAYARQLGDYFRENGYSYWLDKHSLKPGDEWEKVIIQGVTDCAIFLVIMSEEGEFKPGVTQETDLAKSLDKPTFTLLLSGKCWARYNHIQYMNVSDGTMPGKPLLDRFTEIVPRRVGWGQDVTPFAFHLENMPFVTGKTAAYRSGVPRALATLGDNLLVLFIVIGALVAGVVFPGFLGASTFSIVFMVVIIIFTAGFLIFVGLRSSARQVLDERELNRSSQVIPGTLVACQENPFNSGFQTYYNLLVAYKFKSPTSGLEITAQEKLESGISRADSLPERGTPVRVMYATDKNYKIL